MVPCDEKQVCYQTEQGYPVPGKAFTIELCGSHCTCMLGYASEHNAWHAGRLSPKNQRKREYLAPLTPGCFPGFGKREESRLGTSFSEPQVAPLLWMQKVSGSISCWNAFFTNMANPSFDVHSHGFLLYSVLSTLGFAIFIYSCQNALIH